MPRTQSSPVLQGALNAGASQTLWINQHKYLQINAGKVVEWEHHALT